MFRNNYYMTIWKNKDGEICKWGKGYVSIVCSASMKDKNTGEWRDTVSHRYVYFKGEAFETLKKYALAERDRIRVLDVGIKIVYNKAKGHDDATLYCYKVEVCDKPQSNKVEVVDGLPKFDEDGDDLPF